MRIPIPERLPPAKVAVFIAIIFVGQQLAGTDIFFSLLTSFFIGLWAAALNAAGGIGYTSGAYIFFFGIFTAVLGLTVKTFLFEPGEKNLLDPRSTMLCYCVGMTGMLVAAVVSRGLRLKEPIIRNFDNLRAMKQGAVTCLVLSMVLAIVATGIQQTGSILSALQQFNRFQLMAVVLGTAYEVQHSQGKRSFNWIVITSILTDTSFGLLYYSKEGILIGPTAWFITAWLNGFNFPRKQLAGCLLAGFFTVYYLTPYAQYVRGFKGTTKSENLAIAIHYLSDLSETRRLYYQELTDYHDLSEDPHLYDERIAFLDRAIMLPPDDALINLTDQGRVYGIDPSIQAYLNVIPHIIWKSKKAVNTGNDYGHELGGLAEDDVTTGISFSPVADAYHQAKWLGLLLLMPVDLFLAFIIADSVAGSAKTSVWAILPIIEVSHSAAESGLNGCVYFCTQWIIAMGLLVFVTKYAMPYIIRVVWRPGANVVATAPVA